MKNRAEGKRCAREKRTRKRKKYRKERKKENRIHKGSQELGTESSQLILSQSIVVTIDWGIGDRATQNLLLTMTQRE